MALTSQSLFLYGFQVTELNQNLQFKASSGGPVLTAILTLGFYSLGSLLTEVVKQMSLQDPVSVYTVTANRTVSGGTQNRVTIATNGAFLSILFGSGSLSVSSCASLLGFLAADQTGATSYVGAVSAGTALITQFAGYNYLGPEFNQKVFGNVNVSASGVKEAIVFQDQQFIDVEYRYETRANVIANWQPLLIWMMQQKLFDFTPEITSPTVFYSVTLEKNSADGKGLGFKPTEMLSQGFPNLYTTGPMTFRVSV